MQRFGVTSSEVADTTWNDDEAWAVVAATVTMDEATYTILGEAVDTTSNKPRSETAVVTSSEATVFSKVVDATSTESAVKLWT